MSHRREKEMSQNEKHQVILAEMLKDDDNKYCADCDAKGPRWASWNIGIFLCIRCAGIHRNLGVHISRVKSVNLDTWTSEQVAMMQEIGNSRGRAIYEANLPDNFRRPQSDSALEQLIRSKYEEKRYIAKEWVPPKPKSLTMVEEKKSGTGKRRTNVGARPVVDLTRPPAGNPSAVPRPTANGQSKGTTGTAIRRQQAQEQPSAPAPQPAPPKPSHTEDLLGLDDPVPNNVSSTNGGSDDLFGEFLSSAPAPTPQTAPLGDAMGTSAAAAGTSLEKELFGDPAQTAGSPPDQQKSTKESILALYGSQPSLPSIATSQAPNQFLAMPPAGILHSSASAPHMGSAAFISGASGAPGMMACPPGAVTGMPATGQPGFVWSQMQQAPQQHSVFGNSSAGQPAAPAMFGVQHNPFFAQQQHQQQQQQQQQQLYLQQIQQQLSGLQVGHHPSQTPSAGAPAGQTLATNLWQ